MIDEWIDVAEQQLANAEKAAAFWKDLTNDFVFDYIAQADTYRDSANALASEFADLLRDSTIYANTNLPILEKAIADAEEAFEEAAKEPKATFDEAIKGLKGFTPAKDINDTTVNAKGEYTDVAKAIKGTYKFDGAFALPQHEPGDIISTYEAYLSSRWENYANQVSFVFKETEKRDTLKIKIAEKKNKADYEAIVDSVWAGAQTSAGSLDMCTGLWSAYEDFSREYLYDMGKAGLEADADALAAYKDSVQAKYDSILAILKAGKDGQADILMKAWYDKAMATAKSIKELRDKALAMIAADDDATMGYKYEDVPQSRSWEGPAVIFYRTDYDPNAGLNPRSFLAKTGEENSFKMEDATGTFFKDMTYTTDIPVSQAPTAADSAAIFNAIKDFFAAVAAFDEDAVPELKFMASKDGGLTYVIDGVRADKMDIAGLKTQKTNAYLENKGLLRAALYDNKAINPATAVPDVNNYFDALSNVIDLFLYYIGKPVTLNPGLYVDAVPTGLDADVDGYFNFVEWYYNNNYQKGPNFDVYRGFDSPDFVKYSAMTKEGQDLYDWLEACYIYFGVDGFGSFGEGVWFTYNTFKEPTNAIIFAKVPARQKDVDGNIIDVNIKTPGLIYRYYSQYGFIIESIENNLEKFDGGYDANDYVHQIDNSALVFKLFAAEYLYNLATNTESLSDLWAKLGEVLQAAKAAMDKVVTDVDAANKASEEAAKAYNAALKEYRDAIREAGAAKAAAIKEAKDAYDEGLKPIHDAFVEALTDYNFYMKMYNDLCGAYAVHAGSPFMNPEAIIEYCLGMYDFWAAYCANLAGQIAEVKIIRDGIEDEYLDALADAYSAVLDIIAGFDADKVADIEFWYEYWKAAYEAALEYITSAE
jgi:hypothetical protein